MTLTERCSLFVIYGLTGTNHQVAKKNVYTDVIMMAALCVS